MYKRAILLAGGKGTRLKPYTVSLPKPLVPVGSMPIIEIIIRQLAKAGFERITITVNHMADIIKAFCGNGEKWGLQIDYSLEDKPLSTMGPLKLISDLPENFLVMNGDVLTDLNLDQFFKNHCKNNQLFTISASNRIQKVDYGVLQTNAENNLQEFQEKPSLSYLVSMGIYALNKKILDFIPENESFGFDNLMYSLLDKKEKVKVEPYNGYWLDIGRPEDYEKACNDIEENKNFF